MSRTCLICDDEDVVDDTDELNALTLTTVLSSSCNCDTSFWSLFGCNYKYIDMSTKQ